MRNAQLRTQILEAIRTAPIVDRAFIDEYVQGVNKDATRFMIGQHLYILVRDGDIEKKENDSYAIIPRNSGTLVNANPDGEKSKLPPFLQSRSGRLVTITHSPVELEDVARIQLKISGQWITLPLFDDIRICVGPDVPKWNHAQETYTGVAAIKVIFKSGETTEHNIPVNNPVTVAPGE
jgi:hypothetical protein